MQLPKTSEACSCPPNLVMRSLCAQFSDASFSKLFGFRIPRDPPFQNANWYCSGMLNTFMRPGLAAVAVLHKESLSGNSGEPAGVRHFDGDVVWGVYPRGVVGG